MPCSPCWVEAITKRPPALTQATEAGLAMRALVLGTWEQLDMREAKKLKRATMEMKFIFKTTNKNAEFINIAH